MNDTINTSVRIIVVDSNWRISLLLSLALVSSEAFFQHIPELNTVACISSTDNSCAFHPLRLSKKIPNFLIIYSIHCSNGGFVIRIEQWIRKTPIRISHSYSSCTVGWFSFKITKGCVMKKLVLAQKVYVAVNFTRVPFEEHSTINVDFGKKKICSSSLSSTHNKEFTVTEFMNFNF